LVRKPAHAAKQTKGESSGIAGSEQGAGSWEELTVREQNTKQDTWGRGRGEGT